MATTIVNFREEEICPMRRPRGNVARGLAASFLPGSIEATTRMRSKYQTTFHA